MGPRGPYSPWDSPGYPGVGGLSLLQGIFPTQRSNPDFPHCRRILYQLSHRRSTRILSWLSLSLLQWIFLTQELNQGLLHCRWVLYQLNYAEPIINFREGRGRESCLDIEERIAGQLLNLGILRRSRTGRLFEKLFRSQPWLFWSLTCSFFFFFLKDAIQPEIKLTRK